MIDKIEEMTSHDIVNRVRRLTGEKRVGHAGTLDPFATGLLIVGVGRVATREMEKLVGLDKEYETVFTLGGRSDTDDRTGAITISHLTKPPQHEVEGGGIKRDAVLQALDSFVGEIDQRPPTYSAIKIGGKKMYEAARAGKPLVATPRRVTIYAISNRQFDESTAHVSMTIHCSTGTYIRAIARDLGEVLGVGGYVQKLRRTKIGPFAID